MEIHNIETEIVWKYCYMLCLSKEPISKFGIFHEAYSLSGGDNPVAPAAPV